jgi:hypothetical protein
MTVLGNVAAAEAKKEALRRDLALLEGERLRVTREIERIRSIRNR